MHSIASTNKLLQKQPGAMMAGAAGQRSMSGYVSNLSPTRVEMEPASELTKGGTTGHHQRYGSGSGIMVRSASSQHAMHSNLLNPTIGIVPPDSKMQHPSLFQKQFNPRPASNVENSPTAYAYMESSQ